MHALTDPARAAIYNGSFATWLASAAAAAFNVPDTWLTAASTDGVDVDVEVSLRDAEDPHLLALAKLCRMLSDGTAFSPTVGEVSMSGSIQNLYPQLAEMADHACTLAMEKRGYSGIKPVLAQVGALVPRSSPDAQGQAERIALALFMAVSVPDKVPAAERAQFNAALAEAIDSYDLAPRTVNTWLYKQRGSVNAETAEGLAVRRALLWSKWPPKNTPDHSNSESED